MSLIKSDGPLVLAGHAVSQEIINALNGTMGKAVQQYSETFRFITFAGNRFHIKEGGATTMVLDERGQPATFMDWIILNVAPARHHVWYKDAYRAGQSEAVAPDAIWWADQPAPAHVPASVISDKKNVNGRLVNQYQVKHRVVVSPLKLSADNVLLLDLGQIYAVDLSGMSLFGKSEDTGAMSFQGLLQYSARNNTQPLTFPVRVAFGTKESVPYLRFIPFTANNTPGAPPQYFLEAWLWEIVNKAISKEVTDLLNPVSHQVASQAEPSPVNYTTTTVQPQAPAPEQPAQPQVQTYVQPQPQAPPPAQTYVQPQPQAPAPAPAPAQTYVQPQVQAPPPAQTYVQPQVQAYQEIPAGDPGIVPETVEKAKQAARRGRKKVADATQPQAPASAPAPAPVEGQVIQPMPQVVAPDQIIAPGEPVQQAYAPTAPVQSQVAPAPVAPAPVQGQVAPAPVAPAPVQGQVVPPAAPAPVGENVTPADLQGRMNALLGSLE